MYKILRVYLPERLGNCRWYRNQRSVPNYYEILGIDNNSSQKEIRTAFLELSKELHPDMGIKGSHADFVKINEAYTILSKEHTRQAYDIQLKTRHVPYYTSPSSHSTTEREYWGFQEDPAEWEARMKEASQSSDYYGINGLRRVSNGKIALVCILFCILGAGLQMMLIKSAFRRNNAHLVENSTKATASYNEVRKFAATLTLEDQVEAFKQRVKSQEKAYKIDDAESD